MLYPESIQSWQHIQVYMKEENQYSQIDKNKLHVHWFHGIDYSSRKEKVDKGCQEVQQFLIKKIR